MDFNDNDTGDAHFNFDKWYLKGKWKGAWTWGGRNSFPFWKPNEFFWDDDATPAGLVAGYKYVINDNNSLGVTGGYFTLPSGMQNFSGNLFGAQLVLNSKVRDVGLTAAGGYFLFDPTSKIDPATSACDNVNAARFLQNNGCRDYQIIVANLQGKFKAFDMPMAVGADLMENVESYSTSDPDPFTVANRDETTGWDAYIKVGSTKAKGDWLAGYWYARIEQFAVNNSMAQDDWVRWGSATQTRASNMKGHELRGAYALTKKQNLVLRLYIVEAITTEEDGNRIRLDYNIKF